MDKLLYIIRGLPGAGKSTLANIILESSRRYNVLSVAYSEDDFWTDKNGDYHFDPNTREEAFMALLNNAINAMHKEARCIIIHTAALNMNGPIWYIILSMAHICHYQIFPLLLQRNTNNPPSIHDVSDEEMARFHHEMEHDLEVSI